MEQPQQAGLLVCGSCHRGDATSEVSGGFSLSSASDKPNSPGNASIPVTWGQLSLVGFVGFHAAGEMSLCCAWGWASDGHSITTGCSPAVSVGTCRGLNTQFFLKDT